VKRKTLAIPIRLVNFSDTSQILTLFTREQGLVESIAKGAHRERNPFQGPFDLGVLWEVVFAERQPERGLSIITEGTVVEGFREVRDTWARWTGAAFVLEYLRTVGTGGEPAEELFDLAVAALRALGRSGCRGAPDASAPEEAVGVERVLSGFEARALRILGLSAPATACSECGRPWSRSDRPVFFSAQAGGILCGKCHQRKAWHKALVVPGKALRILDDLAALPRAGGEAAPGADWQAEPDLVSALRRILDEMRTTLLDRRFVMGDYALL
jgi:DNA repair protein RecO (recombination protein O)